MNTDKLRYFFANKVMRKTGRSILNELRTFLNPEFLLFASILAFLWAIYSRRAWLWIPCILFIVFFWLRTLWDQTDWQADWKSRQGDSLGLPPKERKQV